MNQMIMSGVNNQNEDNNKIELNENKYSSPLVENYSATLNEVEQTKIILNKVKTDIDFSFDKLNSILSMRNILSNTLKDFNNKTKSIINEKEKILKLKTSIEKIYKMYEESLSIEAFFENTKEECVEKIRYISDYESIENGINFFSLNSSYIEADNYLNTYNMLKRIALTRYHNYMANSIQSFFHILDGVLCEKEFSDFLLCFLPRNMNRKFYNFPKNYEKMKLVQIFFEDKAQYDYEVKKIIEAIKQKFIDQRINMIKPFYQEILSDVTKYLINESNLNTENNSEKIYSSIAEISKMIITELIYFVYLFQTKASENTFILQKLTHDLFSNLYDHLRPIIISARNLDDLFVLFDGFSDYFGIFFQDVLDENIDEVKHRIFSFSSNINSISKFEIAEDKINSALNQNLDKLIDILKVSKILIRPKIMNLVQDIQEKIFFKINLHIKNSLIDIENDFPNLSNHEERISQNYLHFSLFHFFLRRMAVILELLKNKLDKQVLNELTVFAIEKFITLLNEEILNKKNLTFVFEIYIIQQILLGIKILEEFNIEAIQTGVELDFYAITDGFRNNLQSLFTNLSIKDMIINSAPKLFDNTRDFKKILYNKLLKSYKVMISLVNEFVFGRNLMEIVYKIRNKELISDEIIKEKVIDNREVFAELLNNYERIINELKTQIRIIDISLSEKLSGTIIDNLCNIIGILNEELIKHEKLIQTEDLINKEIINKNMLEIRDNLFSY